MLLTLLCKRNNLKKIYQQYFNKVKEITQEGGKNFISYTYVKYLFSLKFETFTLSKSTCIAHEVLNIIM